MKIIFIALLLSACSLTSVNDKGTTTSESTLNFNGSKVVVNKDIDQSGIEVRSRIVKRIDPNKSFKEYSLYFDLDDYTVQEKFLPIIKQHAKFLIDNPNEFVFLEGHTDERGGSEYNLALGQKRAFAVKSILMMYGVKESQIEAYSYGSTKPRALGSNEEAWSQNRRVDFEYRN